VQNLKRKLQRFGRSLCIREALASAARRENEHDEEKTRVSPVTRIGCRVQRIASIHVGEERVTRELRIRYQSREGGPSC